MASTQGGRRAAIHYSLVSSAKFNGVEPFAWLKDVFTRLPYHRLGEAFAQAAAGVPVTSSELDYLLPNLWLQNNPARRWTIDAIRRAERDKKNVSFQERSPSSGDHELLLEAVDSVDPQTDEPLHGL